MEKKTLNNDNRLDEIKSSLDKIIDAKVNLERSVVDFVHSSIKETMDEENKITVFSLLSSALNMQAKVLNKIRENFEKVTDTEKEKIVVKSRI